MKKIFTIFVLSFALLGCKQAVVDTPPAELPEAEPEVEEVALVRAAVFGISVNGISNGATIDQAPVIIAGKVSAAATAVSVNGYQLQNYEVGSGAWNYIAKPEFSNLVVGENTYEIRADGPDDVSTTTTLTINYQPTEE